MTIATRIARADRPGTLFKVPAAPKARRKPREARRNDREHLEAIRQCPCLSCGADPCNEAAHVRLGTHAGIGRKPSDQNALPLCHSCHMDQHAVGELTYWSRLDIAPLAMAARLYRLSPNVEAMRALCFVARVIGAEGRP